MTKRKTEAAAPPETHPRVTKVDIILGMLRRDGGADVHALAAATGWQTHSVRGAIAGHIKKKLGLDVAAERIEGCTVYRIQS